LYSIFRHGSSGTLRDYQNLPSSVTLQIFSYLTAIDLTTIATVCKKWCELANDDSMWKNLYLWSFRRWDWETPHVSRKHANPEDEKQSYEDGNYRWKDFFFSRVFRDKQQGFYKLLKGQL